MVGLQNMNNKSNQQFSSLSDEEVKWVTGESNDWYAIKLDTKLLNDLIEVFKIQRKKSLRMV